LNRISARQVFVAQSLRHSGATRTHR